MFSLFLVTFFNFYSYFGSFAQTSQFYSNNELKIKLNEDGSHYIRGTFATQIWLRYNQNNPGSTIFGVPQKEAIDIGIRRLRMQFYGQVTEKVFFYTQMGENNFTYLNKQFNGFFIHGAVTEYSAVKTHLSRSNWVVRIILFFFASH